eukprot:3901217-Pleurochrysis_carterae.AAC.2
MRASDVPIGLPVQLRLRGSAAPRAGGGAEEGSVGRARLREAGPRRAARSGECSALSHTRRRTRHSLRLI